MGLLTEPADQFISDKRNAGAVGLNITQDEINSLIEERNIARSEKNWQRADEIRDQLLDKGIELKDSAEGTSWKVIDS